MPVLESPRWDNWPIPSFGPERFGHCFLLRLDPAASVAALEDEEATQAASEVPRDWYLGIALSNGRTTLYADDGIALLNFKFGLVGAGLPDFPQASVPVAPATQLAPDRPPLQFIPPLPWNGLYVHTHHYVKAIISRIHYTIGERVATLSPEQNAMLRDDLLADEYNRVDLVRERQEALQQPEDPAVSPDQPAATTSGNDRDLGSSSSSMTGSEFGSEISESEIKYHLREDMQDRFANVRMYVEVWLDPAAHPGLPTDPAKFQEATSRVKQIWKAWQERMLDETLANRPRTNEWLQGVEQADDADAEDVPPDVEAPLDDDAVGPEDAVDGRLETENGSNGFSGYVPPEQVSTHDKKLIEGHTVEHRGSGPPEVIGKPLQPVQVVGSRPSEISDTALPAILPATTDENATHASSTNKTKARKRPLAFLRAATSTLRSTLKRVKALATRINKAEGKL